MPESPLEKAITLTKEALALQVNALSAASQSFTQTTQAHAEIKRGQFQHWSESAQEVINPKSYPLKRRRYQVVAYGPNYAIACYKLGETEPEKVVLSGLSQSQAEIVVSIISASIHDFCLDNELPLK